MIKSTLTAVAFLMATSCTSPKFMRNPANSISADLQQFHIMEGFFNFWADPKGPKTQMILKNNNNLIKFVYLQKSPDFSCSFGSQSSQSSVSEENGFIYFYVNAGDNIQCDFNRVPDEKSYRVFYAMDVLEPISQANFLARIQSAEDRIARSEYDQSLFNELQELGIMHLFAKEFKLTSDSDHLFRRLDNVKKGDYISYRPDSHSMAGIVCDRQLSCKINSNFQGFSPGSQGWKSRYQKKLAFKDYRPLELVCGEWNKIQNSFDKVIFRGAHDNEISTVVSKNLHCIINQPVNTSAKVQTVIGHYRMKGTHISQADAFKHLKNLRQTRLNNINEDTKILNLRRYLISMNMLKDIAVDVKMDLNYVRDLKLIRLAEEEKKLTAALEKRREAELEKANAAFASVIAKFRANISQYAPWESNQTFGDYEYQVKIVPRVLGYSGQIRYELTEELIRKKSTNNFFIEDRFVEYVLLGRKEFITKDIYTEKQPSEVFTVCSEDFHKIRTDLADNMEITSGKQLYKIFRSYRKNSCQTDLRRAMNFQLNLVDDFMDEFETRYCFSKEGSQYRPSSMRLYYDNSAYKEIDRSHPFFKTAPIAATSPSMIKGQKEFCTEPYYGVLPIYSKLSFYENDYAYSPLSIDIVIDNRDKWPNLSAELKAINDRYNEELNIIKNRFHKLRNFIVKKHQQLVISTGIKG